MGVSQNNACSGTDWRAKTWAEVAKLGVVAHDKFRGWHVLFSRVLWPGNPEPKRIRINKVPDYGQLQTEEAASQVLTLIRQRAMSRPLFEVLAEYMPDPPAEQMVPARWAGDFVALKRTEQERGEISSDRVRELAAYPRRGYLEYLKNCPVGRLDDPTIARWYDWLRGQFPQLGQPSIRHVVTDFRTFCGYLKRVGALQAIPAFPRVKGKTRARSVPDRESLSRILAEIPEEERGLWLARSYAGLRPAEARRVDVRDYKAGVLTIRAEICKTGTARSLPIADVAPELAQWIESHRSGARPWDPLFPAPRSSDGRWRPTPERRVWVAALEAAGYEHVAPNVGGRHHFVTHEMTVLQTDARAVRDFVGHASLQTTMNYTHADSRRLSRRMRPAPIIAIPKPSQA